MASIDGGNRWQNATQLKTFRRAGSFSFGDTFYQGKRAEWFQFRTIGRAFNRASFTFAAAVEKPAKFEVFFRPENQTQGSGRRIGQLTLAADGGDLFQARSRTGTYFIKATLRSAAPNSYGVAFSFQNSTGRQAADAAPNDRSGQNLFF